MIRIFVRFCVRDKRFFHFYHSIRSKFCIFTHFGGRNIMINYWKSFKSNKIKIPYFYLLFVVPIHCWQFKRISEYISFTLKPCNKHPNFRSRTFEMRCPTLFSNKKCTIDQLKNEEFGNLAGNKIRQWKKNSALSFLKTLF